MTMSELTKIAPLPGPMAGCELPPDWLVDNFPDLKSGRVWFGVDPAGHAADAMAYAFAGFPRKSRLEQIIEEGLSRMDKAVNRVCDRYDGMRDSHPGLVVLHEYSRARTAFKRANPRNDPLFVWMSRTQFMELREYAGSLMEARGILGYGTPMAPASIDGLHIKFHYDDYIRVS